MCCGPGREYWDCSCAVRSLVGCEEVGYCGEIGELEEVKRRLGSPWLILHGWR